MKKIFGPILLFIVLFILPIGSWLYLKKGLDYRKEALKELEVKGEFQEDIFNVSFIPELKGYTTLLNVDRDVDTSTMERLYDQFGKSRTFQVISPVNISEKENNFHLVSEDSLEFFGKKHFKEASFLLVDSLRRVRALYNDEEGSVKNMIKHISILLPSEAKRKIKVNEQ